MIKKIKSNPLTYPILIVLIIIMVYKCLPIIAFEEYFDKVEVDNTLKYIITTEDKPNIKLLEKLALKLNKEENYADYDKIEYYFLDRTTRTYLWDYSLAIIEKNGSYDKDNYEENHEKIENLCNELSLDANYGYVSISKDGTVENNIKDIDYKNYPSIIARIKFPSTHPATTKDYYADLDEKYHKEFLSWINYLGGNIYDN